MVNSSRFESVSRFGRGAFVLAGLIFSVCLMALALCAPPPAAYADDSDFSFSTNSSTNTVSIVGYYGNGGDVVVPSEYDGKPVTKIASEAFKDRKSITSLTLPKSLEYIDNYAFKGCSGITSLTLPEGIEYFGYESFRGCTGLTELEIPSTITSMQGDPEDSNPYGNYFGGWAFADCTNLKTVTFRDGATIVGTNMFAGCTSLSEVNLPNSLQSIRTFAFTGCTSLTTIDIPEGVVEIYPAAFKGCSNLSTVSLPSSLETVLPLESIRDNTTYGVFQDCVSLKSIEIPNGVKTLGESMFEGCTSLSEVSLGDGVTDLGIQTFSGCKALKSIDIPANVESIGRYCFSYTGLESVSLPGTLTNVGSYCFAGCKSLASVEIPNSVSPSGYYDGVFQGCTNLKSAVLPDGFTELSKTFDGCTSLSDVYVGAGITDATKISNAFRDCPSTLMLHSTGNSVIEKYASDNGYGYSDQLVVRFDTDGGSYVSCQFFTKDADGNYVAEDGNTLVSKPSDPTRTGYKFMGWKLGNDSFDFDSTSVAGNMTIKASWIVDPAYVQPDTKPKPPVVAQDISAAKVTLSKASFAYNGKAQKPSVKSVTLDGKTLTSGTDFTVSIASGKKVGTYKVAITGMGSYAGTATATYTITPKTVTGLKLKKAKKSFKASWTKYSTERSGVQVRYSTKSSMSGAKSVKAAGASAKAKTVKKLKKKTKYYVQVRSYKVVGGKTYYSGWSAKKSVKTK